MGVRGSIEGGDGGGVSEPRGSVGGGVGMGVRGGQNGDGGW